MSSAYFAPCLSICSPALRIPTGYLSLGLNAEIVGVAAIRCQSGMSLRAIPLALTLPHKGGGDLSRQIAARPLKVAQPAPSPLVGEGWGEGACATIHQHLPHPPNGRSSSRLMMWRWISEVPS